MLQAILVSPLRNTSCAVKPVIGPKQGWRAPLNSGPDFSPQIAKFSLQFRNTRLTYFSMRNYKIEQAVQFAIDHETSWSREVGEEWGIHHQDPPPWNRLLGPVHARGPVSGTLVVNGQTLISWGEPDRADLTFSIAKTYLALLAGIAHDRGLLPDVDEPVGARVSNIGFDRGRNAEVTWKHLLQQTSEWGGECFGVPDQVDRYRSVQFQQTAPTGKKGDQRPLQAPGCYWEYNDVRVNQLSLALLHLFGRPLPEVFRDSIMQPIGASDGWSWAGYDNAWIDLGGRRVQSVPGGTHWGGGLSIGSIVQARVGQLLLDDGRANSRQVISAEWMHSMRTPCTIAPFYGYLIWLNRTQRGFPSVPASSYFAIGAGSSFTWLEPERRMVLVVRWIDADYADSFFGRVLQALDARIA
jgi:CubicO group peptidase (beta-lactamase class C family)